MTCLQPSRERFVWTAFSKQRFTPSWILLVAVLAACSPDEKTPNPVLCTAHSQCGARHFCSADQTCICVKSAEGEIRCGKLPDSCGARLCTKSSDCADLGEGYFCDSPNSGCCTDPPKEKPRCIAPCKGPTCPEAQICGRTCCDSGQTCSSGRCVGAPPPRPMGETGGSSGTPSDVTGRWTGASESSGVDPTTVRLELEQTGTHVVGTVLVEGANVASFFTVAEVQGVASDKSVSLTSAAGLSIELERAARELAGVVRFPTVDGEQPYTARLKLRL
jgi:hypothetical protein